MIILIKNFFKSSFRDKTFLFFDWLFPVVLITGIAIFARGKNYATFFLPSLISFLLLQNLIYAIPYKMAQFKENSVLRIIAEEGNVGLYITSFLITRIILVAIQGAVFLPIGIVVLSPEICINPLWLLIAFILSLVAIGGLSMLVASFAKNVNSAYGLSQLFYISLTALSGIFYPIDSYPNVLRVVGKILPLASSRRLMEYALNSKGEAPLLEAIYLLVFGLITLVVGIVIIQKWLNLRKTINYSNKKQAMYD